MSAHERMAPGLLRYGGLAWALCRARKASTCAVSRRAIEIGDAIYRPVSNGRDRMVRVLADVWDRPSKPPALRQS